MRRNTLVSIALLAFVIVSIALFLWVGDYAARYFKGPGIDSRFPEKTLGYAAEDLRKLVTSSVAGSYASPILFPLDFIVMLALSISMGAASRFWISAPYPGLARYALVLPGIYLLADLIEDSLLIWLLRRGDADTAASMLLLLKSITTIKLVSVTGCFVQTPLAFVMWLRHRQ
jgi:hypothetical protein